MNIADFLNEFERLYNNIKKYDMELPKGELAYRQHIECRYTEDKQQVASATMSSFTYDDMKKQLKAIYGNLSTNELKASTTKINVEPTYKVRT